MSSSRNMSITTALILSNIAVFVLGGILPKAPAIFGLPFPGSPAEESILFIRGAYSWYTCFEGGELWRLITYQFLHAGTLHLVFNMWALYFFGSAVEQAMGPRRFLGFYLLCGIAGALFSGLVASSGIFGWPGENSPQLHMVLQEIASYTGYSDTAPELWQVVPMVGASAAIYGVLVAVAFLYPHLYISLIFPPVTMPLRTFAIIVLVLAVVTVLANGNNAGGEAGHLGGIIMSAIIMSIWKWRFLRKRRNDGIF